MIVGTIAAEVPVPRSVMTVVGVCGSLLVVVILPESLPTVVGENDPSNLTVPPGAIVLGVVMPETPKGPPTTESNELNRLAPPALVNVNVPLTDFPTGTLPKSKLVELTSIRGRERVKAGPETENSLLKTFA